MIGKARQRNYESDITLHLFGPCSTYLVLLFFPFIYLSLVYMLLVEDKPLLRKFTASIKHNIHFSASFFARKKKKSGQSSDIHNIHAHIQGLFYSATRVLTTTRVER